MPTSVTMPRLGESVSEGTITRWLKTVGDLITVGEPLLEVSTDKVDTEIAAPTSGVLSSILIEQDRTVDIGTELAIIADDIIDAPDTTPGVTPTPEPTQQTNHLEQAVPTALATSSPSTAAHLTRLVKNLAADRGIDLANIAGTGGGGRITKQDVLAATGAHVPDLTPVLPTSLAPTPPAPTTAVTRTATLRIDITRAVDAIRSGGPAFQNRERVQPTVLSLLVAATVDTLRLHPQFNGRTTDPSSTPTPTEINLSVIANTVTGRHRCALVQANNLNLAGLARQLGQVARTTEVTAAEHPSRRTRTTFVITDAGPDGALTDPSPPEDDHIAALHLGAPERLPLVVVTTAGDEAIALRSVITTSLSYRTKIIDDIAAAAFLRTLEVRMKGADLYSSLTSRA